MVIYLYYKIIKYIILIIKNKVENMKKNTHYMGFSSNDDAIIWFWEVITEYTQE